MAVILAAAGIELIARPTSVGDVAEDGDTLLDNARLKARAVVKAAGGLPVVAEDTGLFVDALGGAPGVRTARFAGEGATAGRNMDLLVSELARGGATDPHHRSARFETVAVVSHPDGTETVGRGQVLGHIATEPRGHGWGYDPLFVPTEGDGRTFAEMSAVEKHAISHRGRALADLATRLTGHQ